MKYFILMITLLCVAVGIDAKVLIITHYYNQPDFIAMQYKTFKDLLLDEHEYVVFNDAPDESMQRQIEQQCAKFDIRCFRVPQEIHTRPYLERKRGEPLHRPNIRHANAVQYSLDTLGFDHDGIVFLVDSDMFLIRSFSIEEYMQNFDIVSFVKGTGISNVYLYLCPALSFLDIRKLPNVRTLNFNCGVINGESFDSGGWTYHYLNRYCSVKIKSVDVTWSYELFLANSDINRPADNVTPDNVKIMHYESLGFRKHEIDFLLKKPDTFEFFFNLNFVHYHAGSNHDRKSAEYHIYKKRIFEELIESAIQNKDCNEYQVS